MRVLVYATGVDTGGQGVRIGQGFARHAPDWTVDVLSNAPSPLGYPEQRPLRVVERRTETRRLYAEADVVHLRNNLDGWRKEDNGACKPIVLHHHGSLFREAHGPIAKGARSIGAVQVASTLDLVLLEPDVEWLPSPYNLAELALLRHEQYRIGREAGVREHFVAEEIVDPLVAEVWEREAHLIGVPVAQFRAHVGRDAPLPPVTGTGTRGQFVGALDGSGHEGESIRIAHFPTSAKVKSTHAFLAATERLAERYPIEVLTNVRNGKVRHMPWSEVLAAKATADIYFDQVQLGYGNNAIEAWGMGLPVVAGVIDPNVRTAMLERFGRLPFVEATEDTIETVLERLIQSRAMRDEYGTIGRDHALLFHDDAKVVAQLQGIYAAAPPTVHVTLPRPTPAWLLRRQARKAA